MHTNLGPYSGSSFFYNIDFHIEYYMAGAVEVRFLLWLQLHSFKQQRGQRAGARRTAAQPGGEDRTRPQPGGTEKRRNTSPPSPLKCMRAPPMTAALRHAA